MVSNIGLGKTLAAAGEAFTVERRRYEEARDTAYKMIRYGYEQGLSEVILARLFGLDRGTIRKVIGKPRPN